ncbi:MAG: 3-isopropylmalate dehydratase large subunit [Deltaproteobacteria bacterium]|nr:3-isopropylmalate dehydratase large subunit [Deltaproteobacteria bacterium]
MATAKNIIDKIWDSHVVRQNPGHPPIIAVDLMMMHEVTSPQAFQMLEEKQLPVFDKSRIIATIDHVTPTRSNRHEIFDTVAKKQLETLRANCAKHQLKLFDYDSGGQGVVHVIGPELGATQPGMLIVCGDSHTATHGAFGALAFGIGTSEVGHVLASGCMLQDKPKTMKVIFNGTFKPGVYAKDAILKLISLIGTGGANGHAIEYCGETIAEMSMEARMTVCNMSIECGARAGLISPDQKTIDYLKGRPCVASDDQFKKATEYWLSLASDKNANFDREITIDVSELDPMVTWGTNPAQAISLSETLPDPESMTIDDKNAAIKAYSYTQLKPNDKLKSTPIQWAFLGSCTNGRIEDLRLGAQLIRGHKVHADVTFYVVPGSERVMLQAQQEGLDKIFIEAGADFRMPGCSMCLGMNDDKVPSGMRCVSSSNRNFVGRQGTGSITHLASPATVVASALKGCICSEQDL